MRSSRLAAGMIIFTIIALNLWILTNFRKDLLLNGDAYISSVLDTHLTQDIVKENKGRIVDRENLEWPADSAKATDMLIRWEDPQNAVSRLESVYPVIYGGKEGIADLASRELFGLHNEGFNAKHGISDLYTAKGHDVHITVSGAFSEKLYTAIKRSGADDGAAVLSNYKTGEILAWTVFPSKSDLFDNTPGKENMLTVQPYQMSVLISSIANNGKVCRPYIISRVISRETGKTIEGIIYDKPKYLISSYLDTDRPNAYKLKAPMERACKTGGTAEALGVAMKKFGYTAAAQTGQTEVSHTKENASGVLKNIKTTVSWIACFLKEKPFVFVVTVHDAKEGSAVKISGEMLTLAVDMNLDAPQFSD